MAQRPKYLLVDSRDRTYEINGTSEFIMSFNPSLEQVRSVKLKALSLPLTHYNVNDTNNKIYFNGLTATLPNGIYNVVNILPEIKLAMEATGYGGIITATFNELKHLYTIDSTTNIALEFGTNTTNSAAYLLGYNNVDTAPSLSLVADNITNLSVPLYFFIDISGLSSPVRTTNNESATFVVFTTSNSGGISFHFEDTHYESNSMGTSGALQQSTITLRERGNRLFNIHGNDWTMLLELTYW
jgi:hypothetical protein